MLYRSCENCAQEFQIKRNPKQKYCSEKACQNARKQHWRQQKLKHDPDYRSNQQESNHRWQRQNPNYWQCYRATHPDYVRDNREKQRARNHRIRTQKRLDEPNASLIAKSDALKGIKSLKTGTYILSAHEEGGKPVAKSDALVVKISILSSRCEFTPSARGDCKETTL